MEPVRPVHSTNTCYSALRAALVLLVGLFIAPLSIAAQERPADTSLAALMAACGDADSDLNARLAALPGWTIATEADEARFLPDIALARVTQWTFNSRKNRDKSVALRPELPAQLTHGLRMPQGQGPQTRLLVAPDGGSAMLIEDRSFKKNIAYTCNLMIPTATAALTADLELRFSLFSPEINADGKRWLIASTPLKSPTTTTRGLVLPINSDVVMITYYTGTIPK